MGFRLLSSFKKMYFLFCLTLHTDIKIFCCMLFIKWQIFEASSWTSFSELLLHFLLQKFLLMPWLMWLFFFNCLGMAWLNNKIPLQTSCLWKARSTWVFFIMHSWIHSLFTAFLCKQYHSFVFVLQQKQRRLAMTRNKPWLDGVKYICPKILSSSLLMRERGVFQRAVDLNCLRLSIFPTLQKVRHLGSHLHHEHFIWSPTKKKEKKKFTFIQIKSCTSILI